MHRQVGHCAAAELDWKHGMESMRVAHLTSVLHGGASALIRIHRGLRAEGIDSRIFAACAVRDDLEAAYPLPSIEPTGAPSWRRKFWKDSSSWQSRIDRASKSNAEFEAFSPPVALQKRDLSCVLRDADILHVHWTGDVVDYSSFFPAVHIPVVWTLHDQNPYLGGFHYQGDVDAATGMLDLEYECREMKRRALAGSNLTVVGNSKWNSSCSRSTDVLPRSTQVETIYLPLPISEYAALDTTSSKEVLGIDPGRFVIGFACAAMGNRRKGFVDLIYAIDSLPQAIKKETTLISFGHPPSGADRQRVSVPWLHLGQPSGGIEQSPIYSAMDVFVFPSIEEAFGQTALESLACQTPVVGTSVGGIPEMVIEGKTGLLAPPRSPRLLGLGIRRFYEDADLRLRCGIAGRELAIRQHASEKIARRHADLYHRLLDTTASARRAA